MEEPAEPAVRAGRLVAHPFPEELRPGEVSIFPTESAEGSGFSLAELEEHSACSSRLYAGLVESCSAGLGDRLGVDRAAMRVVTREVLAHLAHCFFDRLLQLDRFLLSHPGGRFSVPRADAPEHFRLMEDFRRAAYQSSVFNQWILSCQGPLWGLPLDEPAGPWVPQAPEGVVPLPFTNHNFEGRRPWRRVITRLRSAAAAVHSRIRGRPSGRIPALSFSYATDFMRDAGLFGFQGFADLRSCLVREAPEPSPVLRQGALASALAAARPHILEFLQTAGLAGAAGPERVAAAWEEFAAACYPTALLEGLAKNLANAVKLLGPYRPLPLISGDVNTIDGILLFAAARGLGMETVGNQEGGDLGYENDCAHLTQILLPYLDRYVTWGWSQLPPGPARNVRLIPLPSPWLSARKRHWNRELGPAPGRCGRSKEFDLLFLPDKVFPFPPSPTGASTMRTDFVGAFARQLKDLVRECAARHLKVLHKPRDVDTMRLLKRTHDELEVLGGEFYRLEGRLDKGLTRDLLDRCYVVVWDQPGTGLAECLSSRIPTMVLWARIFSRERPEARGLFAELESAGIIHREAGSLLEEVARFRAAPAAWMEDGGRRSAVDAFCRRFAWAEDDWESHWRGFMEDCTGCFGAGSAGSF